MYSTSIYLGAEVQEDTQTNLKALLHGPWQRKAGQLRHSFVSKEGHLAWAMTLATTCFPDTD